MNVEVIGTEITYEVQYLDIKPYGEEGKMWHTSADFPMTLEEANARRTRLMDMRAATPSQVRIIEVLTIRKTIN